MASSWQSLAAPAIFYVAAAALAATAALPAVLSAHVLAGPAVAQGCALAAAAAFCVLHALALAPRAAVKGAPSRLVVVTGCDSGFGLAVATALGARGFRVLAGCLTPAGARGLLGAPNVDAFLLDVTSAPSLAALAARVAAARAGGAAHLFCVVNNAGVGASGPVDWTSLETYRRVMEVNFLGVVAVTKALMGALLDDAAAARAAGEPPVRVVNISSSAGLIAAPQMSAYAASKFAVEAFSDSLRREGAPWGLRVTLVEPSFFMTAILAGGSSPPFATLDAAAQARWGPAWAEANGRGSDTVMANAEPSALCAAVIEAAACDERPLARVRAGTAGTYILPYVAALPAWLSDWLISVAAPSAPEPAGVAAARAAPAAAGTGISAPALAKRRQRSGSVAARGA